MCTDDCGLHGVQVYALRVSCGLLHCVGHFFGHCGLFAVDMYQSDDAARSQPAVARPHLRPAGF